jgi:alpha-amylase/alpha-mannosidase (GH57 family)
MNLKFIKANEISSKAKATIHKSGKLGFSNEATNYLKIKEGMYIMFAQNEDDSKDLNLYAILSEETKEEAFRISKAGEYFYVNTKGMFDSIEVDYSKKTIIYDIVKIEIDGNTIIKFNRREINKKNKEVLD